MPVIYQRGANSGNTTIDRLQQQQQQLQQVKTDNTESVSGQFDNASEDVPISGQFDDADTRSNHSFSGSKKLMSRCESLNQKQPVEQHVSDDNRIVGPHRNDSTVRRNRGFKRMVTRSPSPRPSSKRSCPHLPKAEIRKPTGLDFLASAVAVESAGWRMKGTCGQGAIDSNGQFLSQFQSTASNFHIVPRASSVAKFPERINLHSQHHREQTWSRGPAPVFNNSPSGRSNEAGHANSMTNINQTRPHPIPPMPANLRTNAINDVQNNFQQTNAKQKPRLSPSRPPAMQSFYNGTQDVHAPAPAAVQMFTSGQCSVKAPQSAPLHAMPPAMIPSFAPISTSMAHVPILQQKTNSTPCSVTPLAQQLPSKLVSSFNVPQSPANITNITQHDVMFGRGGGTNKHPGNREFRELVDKCRSGYLEAKKMQKATISRLIVQTIRYKNPPGRFLKKDDKVNMWYEVGDRKAAEKTSQALREGIAQYSSTSINKEADGQAQIITDKNSRIVAPLSPTTIHIQQQLRQIQDEHDNAVLTAKNPQVFQRTTPQQPIENQPWIIPSIVPISVKRRFGNSAQGKQ